MDSRTTKFADEILKKTGGTGVDIVLNSLSGDFIPATLSVLQRQGPVRRDRQAGNLERETGRRTQARRALHRG